MKPVGARGDTGSYVLEVPYAISLNDRKRLRILTLQNGSATLAYELVADSNQWEALEAAKQGDRKCIRQTQILSMTAREVDEEMEKSQNKINQYKKWIRELRCKQDELKDEAERERIEGCHYIMRHIAKVSQENSKLAGSTALHLKVAMNGEQENPRWFDVYFDLEKAMRLTTDGGHLMRMLLDQISQAAFVANGPSSGKFGLIQRLFHEDGQEVTSVRHLEQEDVLFASYGEKWLTQRDYSLQIALFQVIQSDTSAVQLEPVDYDLLKSSSWKTIQSASDEDDMQLVYRDQYGLTANNQPCDRFPNPISSSDSPAANSGKGPLDQFVLLQNVTEFDTVLLPLAMVDSKRSTAEANRTGLWQLSKSGYIRPKPSVCSLVLGIISNGGTIRGMIPQDNLQKSVAESGPKLVECFRVGLVPQDDGNPWQRWQFDTDGYLHSEGDEKQVLTCLQHPAEVKSDCSSPSDLDEEEVKTPPNSSEPLVLRTGLFVAACKPLDRTHDSCQRWAFKQERWSTFGQWRYSYVDNPEWHRKALTWPIDRNGEPNESLIWPIEGQLIPFVPPLNPVRGQPGSQAGKSALLPDTNLACIPKRLRVLKNGEADQSKAIFVTGPNITNKVKRKKNNRSTKVERPESGNGDEQHSEQKRDCEKASEPKLHCTGTSVSEFEFTVLLLFSTDAEEEFLDRCTSSLHMISAARRVFDEDGIEHWSLDNLKRDQLVYITAGEPFINVCRVQQEAKLRAFFNSLTPIIERAARYVSLVDQMEKDWVLTLYPSLSDGAYLTLQPPAPRILSVLDEDGQVNVNTDTVAKTQFESSSAHQRACHASDLRWAEFQRQRFEDQNQADDKQNLPTRENSSETNDSAQKRRSRKEDLQRFAITADGTIYPQANPTMALTIIPGLDNSKSQLELKKRRFGDELQRFKLSSNGFIISGPYVITCELPSSIRTAKQPIVSEMTVCLASPIRTRFGRAYQMAQFDPHSGLIYMMATTSLDRAGGDNFGETGALGPFQGGYLDLSTYEARWSVQHWQKQLSIDLSNLKAMRRRHAAIRKELTGPARTGSVKLLVYNNGDARLIAPKLCIGSSIDGLRDSCTVRMELENPVKLFYTADGNVVNDLCDLYTWAERNYRQVIKQALHWQTWCSTPTWPTEDTWTEDAVCLDLIRQTVRRQSVDCRGSSVDKTTELLTTPDVIYYTHPDVKRLVDMGVLQSDDGPASDTEVDGFVEPLMAHMPESVEDADLWPQVELAPRGDLFQIGHAHGPGQNRDYELVIRISGIVGLLEFLPRCILTVKEETQLTLVLGYEIFGHRILSDLFEPNATVLEDQTEIRIRSRLGPLRNYFTRVRPELRVSMHAVVETPANQETTGNSDLNIGPAIASTSISLKSLVIVRATDDQEEPNIPEQHSQLRLNSRSLQSPRHWTTQSHGECTLGDESLYDTEDLVPCDLITTIYLVEKNLDEVRGRSPSPERERKAEKEEVDWSSLPIEVWASSGEQFVPLHVVYEDVERVRDRAEFVRRSSRTNAETSELTDQQTETTIPDDSRSTSPQSIRRKLYSANSSKRSLYQNPTLVSDKQ
ncbi:unnamed protein product [Echinostoma caproni]|uniref:DUF3668 domain-containing protein n=1 Tax=Echinostoma caproni TaxID=27848 RepID=A0A183A799_9TREM|nr:unnamed protein product [Echinostoma caproni]